MKIVAIIPIKKKSKRVKRKNFRKFNNKPLYQTIIEKVLKCNFFEVYVDSDSLEIKEYCLKNKINFIKRKIELKKDNANGNDLLNYHSKIIDADIYFQIFVTSPLTSIETINNCIKIIKEKKNIDSILTIKKIYSWFWYKSKPINYNPKSLPRSQDATPVIQETTALYGIKKDALKKLKCRIGKKPFFYEVSDIEAIDLDTENDFKILNKISKK